MVVLRAISERQSSVSRCESLSRSRARGARVAALLLGLLLAGRGAEAQWPSIELAPPPTPNRCFRASPPLTYSATGIPERCNTDPWAIIEFSPTAG
jgi:hypothetical protein